MIGDIVKARLKELNLSVPQGAKRCGMPSATLYSVTTYNKIPSGKTIRKICAGLNLDPAVFFKKDRPAAIREPEVSYGPEDIIRVPVVGKIHAGEAVIAEENILRYTCVCAEKALEGHLFGLDVKGDSMYPDIAEGETCIVRKSAIAKDGDIVVALVNHEEAVVRKLYHANGSVLLQAVNSAYAPIIIKESEMFRILGVVIFCQRRFE